VLGAWCGSSPNYKAFESRIFRDFWDYTDFFRPLRCQNRDVKTESTKNHSTTAPKTTALKNDLNNPNEKEKRRKGYGDKNMALCVVLVPIDNNSTDTTFSDLYFD